MRRPFASSRDQGILLFLSWLILQKVHNYALPLKRLKVSLPLLNILIAANVVVRRLAI